jgi:hypothetical protein
MEIRMVSADSHVTEPPDRSSAFTDPKYCDRTPPRSGVAWIVTIPQPAFPRPHGHA